MRVKGASLVAALLMLVGCTTAPPASTPTAAPKAESTASPVGLAATPTSAPPTPLSTPPATPGGTQAGTAFATPRPSTTVPVGSPSPVATARATAYPVSPTPAASPTAVLPSFSGVDAAAHVAKLAQDIGPRPSSSPALWRAADYLRSQLAARGYDARFQSYSFASFVERAVQLRLVQPEELVISARTLVYSGNGTVKGAVVSCGYGKPSDFPAGGVSGKVALIQRGGGLNFWEKAANATAQGALAILLFNDQQGELQGTLGQQASLPVVGILQADGVRLQDYLRRGPTTVTLRVDSSTETRQGNNVVGSARAAPGRRLVLIGAHYDSISAGPGANDNASGVAAMLELANAVRGQSYPFDLQFVAFGDEEIGLVGSRRFVEQLSPDDRSRLLAMINLDMVGVGNRMEFGGDRSLVGRALQIATRMGYAAGEVDPKFANASDHSSFTDAGIPAVFFHRTEDANYHTKLDTADRVLPENLEAAGQVALRLLEALAGRN